MTYIDGAARACALVTGATGFVGSALVERLLRMPRQVVVAAARGMPQQPIRNIDRVCNTTLTPDSDWRPGLDGVDTVFHLAARVHIMRDTAASPLAEFRRVNVNGTMNLARQAAAAGVTRFVFVSSVKVNGEQTVEGRPFGPDDTPAPVDQYGVSKLEAEVGLRQLSAETGMEVVIVRPPLVYGPGVKANFRRMMDWLLRGVPLPFGAIDNRRSLVARDNLTDLLIVCGQHASAGGQTFIAGDGEDLSTTQLLRKLGMALGRPARLVPVPPSALGAAFRVLGKRDLAQRLCGSLQVDIGKTHAVLGWRPPCTVQDALNDTARHYLAGVRR